MWAPGSIGVWGSGSSESGTILLGFSLTDLGSSMKKVSRVVQGVVYATGAWCSQVRVHIRTCCSFVTPSHSLLFVLQKLFVRTYVLLGTIMVWS